MRPFGQALKQVTEIFQMATLGQVQVVLGGTDRYNLLCGDWLNLTRSIYCLDWINQSISSSGHNNEEISF